jgi:transcriptional regulator with XRE-family HTH domain
MTICNNVDIDRVKQLIKDKGLKQKHICAQLGLSETYLSNVKNGKDKMTVERLNKIAAMLDTSYEYLTNQTDNPLPAELTRITQSQDETVALSLIGKLSTLTEDQKNTFARLFALSGDNFNRAMEILKLFLDK